MKKILSLVTVGILAFSSFGTPNLYAQDSDTVFLGYEVSFDEPSYSGHEDIINIDENASTENSLTFTVSQDDMNEYVVSQHGVGSDVVYFSVTDVCVGLESCVVDTTGVDSVDFNLYYAYRDPDGNEFYVNTSFTVEKNYANTDGEAADPGYGNENIDGEATDPGYGNGNIDGEAADPGYGNENIDGEATDPGYGNEAPETCPECPNCECDCSEECSCSEECMDEVSSSDSSDVEFKDTSSRSLISVLTFWN